GGGALIADAGTATFVNTLWRRNTDVSGGGGGGGGGGGVHVAASSEVRLLNNTFNANVATRGSALEGEPITLENSILWGNTGDGVVQWSGAGPARVVEDPIVEGGLLGGGITGTPGVATNVKAVNPLFVANGTNQRLQVGSPGIDCSNDTPLY